MPWDVAACPDLHRPASVVRRGRRRARAVVALVPAALVLGIPAAPVLAAATDPTIILGAYAAGLPSDVVSELSASEAAALAAARPVAGEPETRLAVAVEQDADLQIATLNVAS